MIPRRLHHLLVAPEMIVVDATLALLVALDRALRVEHPSLDDQPDHDDPPARSRARLALRHASRLQRALRAYRTLVRRSLRQHLHDDLPF